MTCLVYFLPICLALYIDTLIFIIFLFCLLSAYLSNGLSNFFYGLLSLFQN